MIELHKGAGFKLHFGHYKGKKNKVSNFVIDEKTDFNKFIIFFVAIITLIQNIHFNLRQNLTYFFYWILWS